MLHTLVGYSRGFGVDTQWFVIDGDEAFFKITKRLHNRLHGAAGDTGGLGRSEADHYATVMDENAAALANRVSRVMWSSCTIRRQSASPGPSPSGELGWCGGATSEQNEETRTPKRDGTS